MAEKDADWNVKNQFKQANKEQTKGQVEWTVDGVGGAGLKDNSIFASGLTSRSSE